MRVADALHRRRVATESPENHPKRWKWRAEWLAYTCFEEIAGRLPGPWVFRFGELLGGIAWRFLPSRRQIVLRNLRIACCGEYDLPTLRRMARETFRRTGANLFSAAHTARLPKEKLRKVIHIENLSLLEESLARGSGVVLLLSHMGNWELLSRLVHLFPKGSKTGAFFRPLNNLLMDEKVLHRRQADGTRMFSRRDSTHHVAGFLRDGGIVGILADQRVGRQGELVSLFGRLTRASPLPSLLARRSKSAVLALSLTTVAPGKWRAEFMPVDTPHTTPNCMRTLQKAMAAGPTDVFWFQDRWKVLLSPEQTIRDWLGPDSLGEGKPHRALLWLAGAPDGWRLPEEWTHPDVNYEIVLAPGQEKPSWLSAAAILHAAPSVADRDSLQEAIAAIDLKAALPIDFILTCDAPKALLKAARRESVPLVSLPAPP